MWEKQIWQPLANRCSLHFADRVERGARSRSWSLPAARGIALCGADVAREASTRVSFKESYASAVGK